MSKNDRHLGMDQSITRRDFLNGVSVAVGAGMIAPTPADAEEVLQRPSAQALQDANYPPALTGMRGEQCGRIRGRTRDARRQTMGHRARHRRVLRSRGRPGPG